MNVLFILTELPYPAERNGVALINAQLLKNAPSDVRINILVTGLAESDHVISSLRSTSSAIDIIHFTKTPMSRIYRVGNLLSGALIGRNILTQPGVKEFLQQLSTPPDVVYASPLMTAFDFNLTQPLFLNAVDSFARLNEKAYRRTGNWRYKLKSFLYRNYERRSLRAAQLVNFVSSDDKQYVQRGNPLLSLVNVSNGVDSDTFFPNPKYRVPGRILFTGNFDYQPNREAALCLAKDIYPKILLLHPNASLHIVGSNPPKEILAQNGITLSGFVNDIATYYQTADVFVCPLLTGAGVKNKILEALSSGLAIVTTSLGVEGISHLKEDFHYVLADDVDTFAVEVSNLLKDDTRRLLLGRRARHIASAYLQWQPVTEKYFTEIRNVKKLDNFRNCNFNLPMD
jgi:glycosyltransferase involved in cell wall biosynthesis